MDSPINKLVIFGVGLIGGSFALALRKAGLVAEIVGVGRSAANIEEALRRGVIDRAEKDVCAALQDCDLVLLALPVGQMGEVMEAMAPYLDAHTVVTDAGSTKNDVVALARFHLPERLSNFVPAHPIAGAEKSGAAAASAELFRDRNVVITPLPETNPAAARLVGELWQACGATVREMGAQSHDEIFAAVSHLPHLLAFALVDEIASRDQGEELFSYAASGFRDFTRIAGSSPEMWRDICLANRAALLRELDAYQAQISRIQNMLAEEDGAALEGVFDHARAARNKWIAKNNLD